MDRKLDCKVMSTNLKRWCSVVALCSATIMASGVVHAEDIPDPFAAVRAQQNAGPNNAPAIATVDAANSLPMPLLLFLRPLLLMLNHGC